MADAAAQEVDPSALPAAAGPRPAAAVTVSTAGCRDRSWWDRTFFAAGFRKHPATQHLVEFEALESEGDRI
ncbi:MAG: hypothetical protein V3S08_10035, partial [Phycisphaerales bacterium]